MRNAYIIQVFGRVQGVGFRFYTERKARELGIEGYVQNRPDGSVYIEAEGPEEQLNQFVAWCHTGPQWARVLEVKLTEVPAVGHSGFRVR